MATASAMHELALGTKAFKTPGRYLWKVKVAKMCGRFWNGVVRLGAPTSFIENSSG